MNPGPTEAPRVPRVYVGAYALCLDASARLLLCRIRAPYPDAGRWTLPGGGLEWGEDPARGVLRELQEETGLAGTLGEVAAVFSRTYPPGPAQSSPVHHLGILYRIGGLRGTLRDETEGSTDRCAWLERGALSALPLVPLAAFALPYAWPGA